MADEPELEKLPEDDGEKIDLAFIVDEFMGIAASLVRARGPSAVAHMVGDLPGWPVFAKLDERLKYKLFLCALAGSVRGAIARSPETFKDASAE